MGVGLKDACSLHVRTCPLKQRDIEYTEDYNDIHRL